MQLTKNILRQIDEPYFVLEPISFNIQDLKSAEELAEAHRGDKL